MRAHPRNKPSATPTIPLAATDAPADRYDYNTVVRLGGQTAAENRAVRQEQTRSREIARANRSTPVTSRDGPGQIQQPTLAPPVPPSSRRLSQFQQNATRESSPGPRGRSMIVSPRACNQMFAIRLLAASVD
jgi:hypothetical protein